MSEYRDEESSISSDETEESSYESDEDGIWYKSMQTKGDAEERFIRQKKIHLHQRIKMMILQLVKE